MSKLVVLYSSTILSPLLRPKFKISIELHPRELDFVIGECLNSGTKAFGVYLTPDRVHPPPTHTLAFPNRYLIDIASATKFANLKRVVLEGRRLVFEEDIPAPWRVEDLEDFNETTGRHIKVLTRD